jgi:UDP-glucuronate 4-epimerase
VYGPFGRPDMAYFSFTDNYFKKEPIKIFNNGDFKNDLYRDFTYIDDIVEGILNLLNKPTNSNDTNVFYKIYNIGNNTPIKLMEFIEVLENSLSNSLSRKIVFDKKYEPLKPGDVKVTYASTDLLYNAIGFKPHTSLKYGLQKFMDWYVDYYKIK